MKKILRLFIALAAFSPLFANAASNAFYGHPPVNSSLPVAYIDIKNMTGMTFVSSGITLVGGTQAALILPPGQEMYFTVDFQADPCEEISIADVTRAALVLLPNPICGSRNIVINAGANGVATATVTK